jgi:beta-glucosidase
MFMVPRHWKPLYKNTLKQVKAGEIPMERLDDAVRRILRVKMRAGLFERGKPSSRSLGGRTEILRVPCPAQEQRQSAAAISRRQGPGGR